LTHTVESYLRCHGKSTLKRTETDGLQFTLLELQLSTSEHDLVTRRREYCQNC